MSNKKNHNLTQQEVSLFVKLLNDQIHLKIANIKPFFQLKLLSRMLLNYEKCYLQNIMIVLW